MYPSMECTKRTQLMEPESIQRETCAKSNSQRRPSAFPDLKEMQNDSK